MYSEMRWKAICELKSDIKRLAQEQHQAKSTRKQVLREDQSSRWCEIRNRSSEISASINFYLMLRGKRSRISKGAYMNSYAYESYYAKLEKKYPAQIAEAITQ